MFAVEAIPSEARSQISLQELRAPVSEGPVLTAVTGDRHHQVGGSDPVALLQPLRQSPVKRSLLCGRAPLLENLDEHHSIGANKTKAGVLEDEVARTISVMT
jgi:hypothetical protein